MSNVVDVNDSNFETEVLNSTVPVLVDFSATWCGPCQRQTPIVEKFAAEHGSEVVKVCKVDIDDAPAVAAKLGIRSVPSLLLFSNGQKVETKVGLTSLRELNELLAGKIK
jgi:thioredoxin 1